MGRIQIQSSKKSYLDPDPEQTIPDPQHCFQFKNNLYFLIVSCL